jgi:hypothetical protein
LCEKNFFDFHFCFCQKAITKNELKNIVCKNFICEIDILIHNFQPYGALQNGIAKLRVQVTALTTETHLLKEQKS